MRTRAYKQTVTYWGSPVPNGTGGYSYGAPVTFKARWEERTETITTDTGESYVSRITVYIPQAVDRMGYLFLGTSVALDPTLVDGAHLIRAYREIPPLLRGKPERKVYL